MKKQKQPDRWEREAKKESMKNYGLMSWFGASNLLRREHRAIVRLVRKMPRYRCESMLRGQMTTEPHGRWIAIDNILAKLKARGK